MRFAIADRVYAVKAMVPVMILAIALAIGAYTYTHTLNPSPVSSLTLHTGGAAIRAGDTMPITIGGCVSGNDSVPIVVLTVFSEDQGVEALLGPAAASLAKPGCRTTDTSIVIPLRATPGMWRVILLSFTPNSEVQTRVVVSDPFEVVE